MFVGEGTVGGVTRECSFGRFFSGHPWVMATLLSGHRDLREEKCHP